MYFERGTRCLDCGGLTLVFLLLTDRELQASKARLELELESTQPQLEKLQAQISILDAALNNAQASVQELEEEVSSLPACLPLSLSSSTATLYR